MRTFPPTGDRPGRKCGVGAVGGVHGPARCARAMRHWDVSGLPGLLDRIFAPLAASPADTFIAATTAEFRAACAAIQRRSEGILAVGNDPGHGRMSAAQHRARLGALAAVPLVAAVVSGSLGKSAESLEVDRAQVAAGAVPQPVPQPDARTGGSCASLSASSARPWPHTVTVWNPGLDRSAACRAQEPRTSRTTVSGRESMCPEALVERVAQTKSGDGSRLRSCVILATR